MLGYGKLGPLIGGPYICRMLVLRNVHVPCDYFYNFENVPCHLSNLRNTLSHVVYFYSPVVIIYRRYVMSTLRNGHVAVSNLRVKSPCTLLTKVFFLSLSHSGSGLQLSTSSIAKLWLSISWSGWYCRGPQVVVADHGGSSTSPTGAFSCSL